MIQTLNVHSVKEAAPGHVWALDGKVISKHIVAPTLPIISRRLYVMKDGTITAENAFIITVVQAPNRFLLATAREPVGDVTFEAHGTSFGMIAEESSTLQSRAEAEEYLAELEKRPTASIEEELTLATLEAISSRLKEAGAAAPKAAAS